MSGNNAVPGIDLRFLSDANVFDLGLSNLEFRFEVLRLNYARQICSRDNLLAFLCGHLLQHSASAGRDAQILNLLLLEFQ